MGEKAMPQGKPVRMLEKDLTTINDSAAATFCEPNLEDSHRICYLGNGLETASLSHP